MNKLLLCSSLSLVFFGLSEAAEFGDIHPDTQEALRQIYRMTDGDNWLNNEGWSPDGVIDCEAFGISCGPDAIVYFPHREDFPTTVIGLELPGNNLVGTLPGDLSPLYYLQKLDLSDNGLSGALPTGWRASLQLDLSDNDFTGPVPEGLWGYTLISIDMSGNRLTAMPTEDLNYLGHTVRTELQKIDMSHNAITALPDTLANMVFMWSPGVINLSDNQLSGEFPESLLAIEGLSELDLSHNALTGTLPGEPLPFTVLDVSFNQLSGELPQTLPQSEIGNRESGQLTLDFNGLYSHDDTVLAFVRSYGNPEFPASQTLDPSGLSVAAVADDSVQLVWEPSSTTPATVGGYVVELSRTIDGPFETVLVIEGRDSVNTTLGDLQAQTDYWVRVLSYSELDPSALADEDMRQEPYTLFSDGKGSEAVAFTTLPEPADDGSSDEAGDSKKSGGALSAALSICLLMVRFLSACRLRTVIKEDRLRSVKLM